MVKVWLSKGTNNLKWNNSNRFNMATVCLSKDTNKLKCNNITTPQTCLPSIFILTLTKIQIIDMQIHSTSVNILKFSEQEL